MSVIEGASVSVKTMSDGTLRLSIDIEPRNAQAAFALFGAPGRAVALAALKDGAGAVTEIPVSEKPKGGEWAKLAGMWCADRDFWAFCVHVHGVPIANADDAALLMRQKCGIDTRAQLDHSKSAFDLFNQYFRHPFMKWMISRGIQK
jgi:hypothetical protein